jgi:hypothetical protein
MARGIKRFGAVYLRRNGLYKGLLGGSRGWLTIFGLLSAQKFIGKYVGRDEQKLTLDMLKPGQSMTITAIPAPTRKQRKGAKRTAKADERAATAAAAAAKKARKDAKRARRAPKVKAEQ